MPLSTGSISLDKLKVLAESLCDRDEALKDSYKYVKLLLKRSTYRMTELKIKLENGISNKDLLNYIEELLSEINDIQVKVDNHER